MFIDTTAFTGPLAIANLTQPAVIEAVESAIDRYEPELLSKALGESLYQELVAAQEALTSDEELDEKWLHLLDGYVYTYYNRKSRYDGLKEAIAAYVWYNYTRDTVQAQTPVGTVQGKAENAYVVSPAHKLSVAWNMCRRNIGQLWDVLSVNRETYPEYVSSERDYKAFRQSSNPFGI